MGLFLLVKLLKILKEQNAVYSLNLINNNALAFIVKPNKSKVFKES